MVWIMNDGIVLLGLKGEWRILSSQAGSGEHCMPNGSECIQYFSFCFSSNYIISISRGFP